MEKRSLSQRSVSLLTSGLFAVCLVLFGGQDGLAQSTYKEITKATEGTIEGTVILTGGRGKKSSFDVTKDDNICGKMKPAESLIVGKKGGVQNAVVYLEAVKEGKPWPEAGFSILNQRGCEYSPHISIIPAGNVLEIVNNDPILHNVHLYNFSSVDQTICNIAQPVKGQRTKVEQLKSLQCRFLHATCDAGHPWMSAYIVRADNPYYALTDANGNFRLTNVPPGTYKLTMWHEGIRVTKTLIEQGKVSKYYFEEPYTSTQEITVPQKGLVRAEFQMAAR